MALMLKANKRTQVGTRAVRKLRKAGSIPGIIYGHSEAPLAITTSEHDVELALQHGERVLEMDVDGETINVLIKDVQYDTFGHEVLHVDLTRVNLDERVEVTVPVVLRGTPAGAEEGGVLSQNTSDVTIECVVTAIPEELRVDVNAMKIGDVLHLSDLTLPEGAELVDEPEAVLCSVQLVAEEEEEEEEEAVEDEQGAEPEVIGGKPEEDKDEAEEK